jgi:hypothetical protein
MILQDGWIKDGVPNIWTYIYDPTYTGDHVLFLEDETVLIFNNLGEYIVNCSLSGFQFLGIPPKGEQRWKRMTRRCPYLG